MAAFSASTIAAPVVRGNTILRPRRSSFGGKRKISILTTNARFAREVLPSSCSSSPSSSLSSSYSFFSSSWASASNSGLPILRAVSSDAAVGPSVDISQPKHHPLDDLTSEEMTVAADAVKALDTFGGAPRHVTDKLRFNYITLAEPPKAALLAYLSGHGPAPPRVAEVLVSLPSRGASFKAFVHLGSSPGDVDAAATATVTSCDPIPDGCQPLFSPDDCNLAETIVKADPEIAALLKSRYGIDDLTNLVCDPWSIHIATPDFAPLRWREDKQKENKSADGADDDVNIAPRLVQTFLYWREDLDDNQYAKPIDLLPVVDLNAGVVVDTSFQPAGADGMGPKISEASVNYHRAKLASNSYLSSVWRASMPPLDVVQPEGPSFEVDGRVVTWDKWSLRVGFNYREGLVLHDVKYDGRPVMHRASLVEMAVPYADPNPPFERKCAFDVGDYGLGYCTDSLELGCDCLGNIHYFDAALSDSEGAPYEIKKAICMHEEDHGVLWKHVEFRTGHSEARRSRRLVLSFIATVVNYEYLFYWYLLQDGTIEYEIKLSGMLSTNMLSAGERGSNHPEHGVLVAPGVNAQVHQHMFCARLDMAVDGYLNNAVEEVDCVYAPGGFKGDFDNVFGPVSTPLTTVGDVVRYLASTEVFVLYRTGAVRTADQSKARTWKITNPESLNPITGKPVGYKLVPFTRGAAMPTLLTGPECAVTHKGAFATQNLWVTPHADDERWPAGEFTVQGAPFKGLPEYVANDRDVSGGDLVLWHSFGVVHVPRPEDFPVMPVEHTGFSLKPDGFFSGNPSIDLPPSIDEGASKCCSHKN